MKNQAQMDADAAMARRLQDAEFENDPQFRFNFSRLSVSSSSSTPLPLPEPQPQNQLLCMNPSPSPALRLIMRNEEQFPTDEAMAHHLRDSEFEAAPCSQAPARTCLAPSTAPMYNEAQLNSDAAMARRLQDAEFENYRHFGSNFSRSSPSSSSSTLLPLPEPQLQKDSPCTNPLPSRALRPNMKKRCIGKQYLTDAAMARRPGRAKNINYVMSTR